jgi:hypothetical protein
MGDVRPQGSDPTVALVFSERAPDSFKPADWPQFTAMMSGEGGLVRFPISFESGGGEHKFREGGEDS